jgi:putative membrane protein (TIGR04086 family)
MIDLDADALRRGIAVAAAIAVPIAVVANLVVDDSTNERTPVLFLFSLGVLAALVIGALVAGQAQRTGTPMAHGIVTAVTVWLVLTVVRLIRLTIDAKDIAWSPVLSNLLLSLIAGTVGGLLGGRRATRRASQEGTLP